MSKQKRDYKAEYKNYHSKPEQKKERAARNAARRKMEKQGKVHKGDGKDVDHKNRNPKDNSGDNLRVQSDNDNRSYSRKTKDRKKYGKRYK